MFQLDFMLDLQITHVINPCEQEIRFDPTKYAKQGICYKGFICKVRGRTVLVPGQSSVNRRTCLEPTYLSTSRSARTT